jgi:hypothetical protein
MEAQTNGCLDAEIGLPGARQGNRGSGRRESRVGEGILAVLARIANLLPIVAPVKPVAQSAVSA